MAKHLQKPSTSKARHDLFMQLRLWLAWRCRPWSWGRPDMHNHASAHAASFGCRYTANAVRFNLGQAGARAVEQAASALPFLPLFFSAGNIQHEMRSMCRALASALPSFISACAWSQSHAHSTIAILLVQVAIPVQLHLFRSSFHPRIKLACLVKKKTGLLGSLAPILLARLPMLANPPISTSTYIR